MVGPLVHNEKRALHLSEMAYAVLSKNGNTVRADHIRNTVVDFRVDMVRTSGKHNAVSSGFFKVFKSFFALLADVFANLFKFFVAVTGSNADFLLGNALLRKMLNQTVRKNLLRLKGKEFVLVNDIAV